MTSPKEEFPLGLSVFMFVKELCEKKDGGTRTRRTFRTQHVIFWMEEDKVAMVLCAKNEVAAYRNKTECIVEVAMDVAKDVICKRMFDSMSLHVVDETRLVKSRIQSIFSGNGMSVCVSPGQSTCSSEWTDVLDASFHSFQEESWISKGTELMEGGRCMYPEIFACAFNIFHLK